MEAGGGQAIYVRLVSLAAQTSPLLVRWYRAYQDRRYMAMVCYSLAAFVQEVQKKGGNINQPISIPFVLGNQ